MHYIEYIPGTIARITTHPTNIGSEDVNLLSRFVSAFNRRLQFGGDKVRRNSPLILHDLASRHNVLLSP